VVSAVENPQLCRKIANSCPATFKTRWYQALGVT